MIDNRLWFGSIVLSSQGELQDKACYRDPQHGGAGSRRSPSASPSEKGEKKKKVVCNILCRYHIPIMLSYWYISYYTYWGLLELTPDQHGLGWSTDILVVFERTDVYHSNTSHRYVILTNIVELNIITVNDVKLLKVYFSSTILNQKSIFKSQDKNR